MSDATPPPPSPTAVPSTLPTGLAQVVVEIARQTALEVARSSPAITFRPATSVGGEPGPGLVTVILDGDTVELTIPTLVPLANVGQRVMVALTPPSGAFVVGYINGNETFPVGAVIAYTDHTQPGGGSGPPRGWVECNGQALAKLQYPALYAVIGVRFGGTFAGTTFNVPDLRSRTIIGVDAGAARTTLGVVGSTAGSSTAPLIAHTHTLAVRFNTNPSHTHSGGIGGQAEGASPDGGVATPQTTGSTGSAGADANLQPTMALSWIIKA